MVVLTVNCKTCQHLWYSTSPKISSLWSDIWAWFYSSGTYNWCWNHKW